MKKILILLYSAAALIIFIILAWYISVPTSLIEDRFLETVSRSAGPDIRTEITGLSKGPFFNLHLDGLDVYYDDKHAIKFTDLTLQLNPVYLLRKNLAVTLDGKLGSGDIHGDLRLPEGGTFSADSVELASIPYLRSLGVKASGQLSAEVILKKDSMEARFRIDRLQLNESPLSMIPLINSFEEVQGMVTMKGKRITVHSLSLDGEKGYARAKGDIINGSANMTFELMPEFGELEDYEKMLIKKYESSPGHYVIPFSGKLPL
jgi:type II secretion system protein N